MNGADLIAAERQRQVEQEGWTPGHDDEHGDGSIAEAALSYLLLYAKGRDAIATMQWPWDEGSWKPSDDSVRNLVKAGALIAAEIDRLQRAG